MGGRMGVIFVSRSDLNLFFLYYRITTSYFLSALFQVCLSTAGWALVCHSLLLPSSAQGRIICTEQDGTFLHFLSCTFLFHPICSIPTADWCNTMRYLKPQKLCEPDFFFLPNGRAETSWGSTDVKLTLPVRLTYLSPASCSSGQWGHRAGANALSAAQQLLHPAYKAMEGDWACHPAVPWAQRPRDLLTFTHIIRSWCWAYLCCLTPHPALNCIITNTTFTVALSRWLGPVLVHSCTGTCPTPYMQSPGQTSSLQPWFSLG